MVFSATSGFGVGLFGIRPPQGSVPSCLPGVSGRPSFVPDLLYLSLHFVHVHSSHCHRLFQRYPSFPAAVVDVPYPYHASSPPPILRRCLPFLFSCEVYWLPSVFSLWSVPLHRSSSHLPAASTSCRAAMGAAVTPAAGRERGAAESPADAPPPAASAVVVADVGTCLTACGRELEVVVVRQ